MILNFRFFCFSFLAFSSSCEDSEDRGGRARPYLAISTGCKDARYSSCAGCLEEKGEVRGVKWNHVAFASYFYLDMYWVVVRMGGLAHSLARVKLRSLSLCTRPMLTDTLTVFRCSEYTTHTHTPTHPLTHQHHKLTYISQTKARLCE